MVLPYVRSATRRLVNRLRWRRAQSADSDARPKRLRWPWAVALAAAILGVFFWRTSARILAEPVTLAYGPMTPAFAESLGPLLGAEFTSGNAVRLFSNGDEFFPAMLKDIRAAKKTVTLEVYIWSSGIISNQFIDALSDRAKAGVKVHVLVDGMGSLKFKDEDQKRLLDSGVEFVMYGREHWWELKPDINHRTHRKLLVVDGRVGYTGGMCVDDAWLGNAENTDRWREIQLRAEGPVVHQMQSVFATNWLQTTGRMLVGPDYFLPNNSAGPAIAQCYKSGPDEDPENARVSYMLAIAAARKSIRIAHAYFVPDELAIKMLVDARQRGVEIEVIVPAVNDSRFGRAAARSRWGKLLEAGVVFNQYKPAMYHPKMMIVDEEFVTIGSVNFDNRSFRINDEANVNVLNQELARSALRLFESDRKASEQLTLEAFNARPWWQKLVDYFCGLFRSQL
jgi:cardiolipin synthase A/B